MISNELVRLVRQKADSTTYQVGPLNLRFYTLEDARAYAKGLSYRIGRRVYIHSPEGKTLEVIDSYERPQSILI